MYFACICQVPLKHPPHHWRIRSRSCMVSSQVDTSEVSDHLSSPSIRTCNAHPSDPPSLREGPYRSAGRPPPGGRWARTSRRPSPRCSSPAAAGLGRRRMGGTKVRTNRANPGDGGEPGGEPRGGEHRRGAEWEERTIPEGFGGTEVERRS